MINIAPICGSFLNERIVYSLIAMFLISACTKNGASGELAFGQEYRIGRGDQILAVEVRLPDSRYPNAESMLRVSNVGSGAVECYAQIVIYAFLSQMGPRGLVQTLHAVFHSGPLPSEDSEDSLIGSIRGKAYISLNKGGNIDLVQGEIIEIPIGRFVPSQEYDIRLEWR